MARQQVLTLELHHRNFCCWSSGRDWQRLYSSSWICTEGMEVVFLEELSGGGVRWNPSFPTGPLGERAFFVHILPKLPFFYPVPSSLLLTCLCPTTGSFLLLVQPCSSVLTPLPTSALVCRLVSPWITPLCHILCVWHPQAHLLSQLDAQRHLFVQPALWFLSLPVASGCMLLVSFLGSCLPLLSSYLPRSSENLVQSRLLRQYQFHASTSDPELSLVPSLQHCWLLVPAVVSRLRFSSSLYPACLPLNTFSLQLQLLGFISGVSQSQCLSLRLSVLVYFSSPFLQRAGSGVCPPCAQIIRLLPLAAWAQLSKSPGA